MQHLILNLEAPLMAFGGEIIDNYGVIRWFPSASMITGLLANALGWRRTEGERHQHLQERLTFAVRIDREPAGGVRMRDFQTARLDKNDKGWTTQGQPEGRAGGANTYDAPLLRYRDYFADMRVTVALRLEPADATPTLDDLADALEQPARPLFIGRKPCLPSAPLFSCFSNGDTALAALLAVSLDDPSPEAIRLLCDGQKIGGGDPSPSPEVIRLLWPDGEDGAGVAPSRTYMLTDERNWISGLHGGGRLVCEGSIARDKFPVP